MQTKKAFKGFYFFYKGLQYANAQMWVSLQVLVVLTGVLAVVLYFVEHTAQPEVYTNLWDSMVWSFMAYLGNPGKFACGDPITFAGRIIWIVISLLKIALFAVPAGLIANGQWKQIAFAKDNWNEGVPAKVVHCTDGEVEI